MRKFEIRAKRGVQLTSIGRTLSPGDVYVFEGNELPQEVKRAEGLGLVNITEPEKPKASKPKDKQSAPKASKPATKKPGAKKKTAKKANKKKSKKKRK